ncbi:exported protein of unknown function [Candidatus Saccharimonas aalborgensis]|jgi:hypothetical protein|uniref:Uncharacterized protein n=2 Tax=Candidatus Saccharimonas aalborgensis TaxID=1332188 RepID=R4PUU2_9BACT|nr:exported protein of unknown function [Candidatus Saccharimonas aalborgensis]
MRYTGGMKKRSQLIIILACLIVVGAGVTFLLFSKRSDTPTNTGTNDITKALRCDRATADYTTTDPLCTNTDYARQLFERGITFGVNVPGTGTKPSQVTLVVITNGAKAQPLARTRVKVSSEVKVQCIKAPCNPVSEVLTEATTDELGVISLPALPSGTEPLITLIVEADGHPTKRESIMRSDLGQYLVRID